MANRDKVQSQKLILICMWHSTWKHHILKYTVVPNLVIWPHVTAKGTEKCSLQLSGFVSRKKGSGGQPADGHSRCYNVRLTLRCYCCYCFVLFWFGFTYIPPCSRKALRHFQVCELENLIQMAYEDTQMILKWEKHNQLISFKEIHAQV